MIASMKKITWCVIYLFNKSKLHIVQLHFVQKYMDVAYVPFQVCRVFVTFSWIKLSYVSK